MNTKLRIFILLPALAGTSVAMGAPSLTESQLGRLFHPTPSQVAQEHKGRIFIYDGLTEKHVEASLNRQFDRVDSMMFVNVVKTDERGEPITDPDTEMPVTEDDGC